MKYEDSEIQTVQCPQMQRNS